MKSKVGKQGIIRVVERGIDPLTSRKRDGVKGYEGQIQGVILIQE